MADEYYGSDPVFNFWLFPWSTVQYWLNCLICS